ncbi:Beauvericin cluster-specific repressor BEA4 [Paramyrothecium foliicola]|nr:Beauvericin cluster-specific repressor BEA4 [Paramyrothecium foliicola]
MSRSRNGCMTCKRRHRKCDETRPVCQACQAQGIECEGYNLVLRWNVGVASRGYLAGVSTPIRNSHEHSIRARQSLTSDSPTEAALALEAHSPSASPSEAWDTPESGSSLQQEQQMIANEFFKEHVYLLYSTRRDHDLPRLLYEMCRESETFSAIVAATHLYVAHPDNPGPAFERYYSRGFALFRSQLDMYNGSLDASVITAGLFICTLNVRTRPATLSPPSADLTKQLYQGIPWSSLLEHMVNVYELRHHLLHPTPQLNQAVISFSLEAMAVMDLPTFVRGRHTVTIGIWAQMRAAQDAYNGGHRRGGVETLSGLPRSLLDIFAMIQRDEAEAEFLAWPGEIGEVPFCHLWEAYRLAGILTSRRLRDTANDGSPRRNLRDLDPTASDILVGRLIAALDALCETRDRPEYADILAQNSIFYPYVAARLEVAVLVRHDTWIDTLRRIYRLCNPYGDTSNAKVVDELLEEAFQARDDNYDIDEQARRREVEIALF